MRSKPWGIAAAALAVCLATHQSSAQDAAFHLTPWQSTTNFAGPRTSLAAVLSNNRVYILGGLSSTATDFTLYDDVQTAVLGNDGAVTSAGWRATTALPNGRSGLGATIYDGRIYVVGGYAKSGTLADTLSAPMKPDGSIGAWKVSPSSLNIPRSNLRLEVFRTPDGHSFLGAIAGVGEVGGDPVHFDSVEVASLEADGSVGSWHVCPFHLKGGRSAPATIVEAGVLYVLGGWGDRLDDVFRDVQYARIRNDGCPDPWLTSPNPLNMPLYGHAALAVKANNTTFFVAIGGNGGEGNYFNNVQAARLEMGGDVGPWAFERHTLAVARWGFASVRYGDFIYVIGGAQTVAPGYLADVHFSSIQKAP